MFLFKKEIDDEKLVLRLKEGSHKAFETLFRRYYASVCAYAARFVDIEDAEDVADDVMVWLWEKRAGIDIQTTFRQYLFTMVYHRACKVAMRNRLAQETASYMDDYRKRHELNEEDFMLAEELKERIKKAIVSPKTIDYRIQQALKLLRKELGDYLPAVVLAVVMGYLESSPLPQCERHEIKNHNQVLSHYDATRCNNGVL